MEEQGDLAAATEAKDKAHETENAKIQEVEELGQEKTHEIEEAYEVHDEDEESGRQETTNNEESKEGKDSDTTDEIAPPTTDDNHVQETDQTNTTEANIEHNQGEEDQLGKQETGQEVNLEESLPVEEEPFTKADGEDNIADGFNQDDVLDTQKEANEPESETEKIENADEDGVDAKQENEAEKVLEESEQLEDESNIAVMKEEEDLIPADFYYNFEELESKAVVAQDSGIPLNMLELKHSYGYDCKRRNNLQLLDENHVIFAAGNLVQILNLKSREQRYLRSTSGCGIGAICVHPSHKFFAVGEKGSAPNINIFEYPSLKLYRILRGGTEESYASLAFSPDGELLASQGGDPDFMLTVWNWKQEKITLRTKSFSQDVFRVSFAPELEGQLTTAGTGHIRFWKMADTFTGLKLQGELGRFGRTEISDIEGYVELPDGKVLSGAEWGNMLLWEGGLIKVEITCRGKKNCHQGPIMQILLDEGELMTIGVDGYIRVWDFEAIDTADATDDSGIFEMDPMNELKVGTDAQLYCIVKSIDEENEPTIWYAQDANGGIWRLDLSFSHTSQAPEKLFTYHAGPISGCVTSPVSHIVVSTGLDKTVRVYDYIQMKQLAETKFTSGGTAIEWVPLTVDSKGGSVIVGFEDGVVRALNVTSKPEEDNIRRPDKQEAEITLKQAFKPHKNRVTALAFDGKGEILATGGADGTVFFLYVSEVYDPIGFIKVPGPVRQLSWTPEKFKKQALLVVCDDGVVVEVDSPEPGNFDTSHSYEISGLNMRTYTFKSIKSYLRHEEELERERIADEERKKKEQEERRKRIERGLETESDHGDEEVQKPKTPPKEWHPFIPKDPSKILHATYSEEEGNFWLSMGDFDAGYLYECRFLPEEEKALMMPDNIDKPLRAIPVSESSDIPIEVIQFSNSGQSVVFGMANGQLRVQQLNEPNDLSELGPQWTLSMHDNSYGKVTSVVSSFDGTMVLTSGADGNFFQFSFMTQEELEEKIKENKAKLPSARYIEQQKLIDDIEDPNAYSIEDAKQKSEYDKRMKEAEHKKKEVKKKINQLRRQFRTIIEQNENLPKHLQLNRMEFEMDKEIKQELEQRTLEKIDTVKKEMAWESEKLRISLEKLRKRFKDCVECERIVVKAFTTQHEVTSFRASKLSEDFYQIKAEFERKKTKMSTKDDLKVDASSNEADNKTDVTDGEKTSEEDAGGGKGVTTATNMKGNLGDRITNALQKVEEKKRKRALRRAQWEELYSSKPDDDCEDPNDVAAIKEAQENMGDFKLKTAADYVVPDHLRMNVEKAQWRLLTIKDLIHDYKYEFNQKLLALRDSKIQVINEVKEIVEKLKEIQSKLDPERLVPIPPIPELTLEEMPERVMEYTKESLKKFKIEYDIRQKQAKTDGGQAGSGGGFGFGFGGGGGSTAAPALEKQMSEDSVSDETNTSKISTGEKEEKKEVEVSEEIAEDDTVSPLEKQIHQIEQIRLTYEQNQLLQHIQNLFIKFDAELRLLRHDKFKLDIVMMDADLRQVTLFEELVLLKEYEKREDVLAEKVVGKQNEKSDMQAKMLEVQSKIDLKKKDIDKLLDKEKALMGTFTQSLGENNKFAEYLTKVFKKKVKRTKKKANDGGDSEEDSDDDSDDESEWEESDEESESEAGGYDLDVCPPGCDQKLYDDTCMLREKRLDLEELLTDEKKNQDVQKKELDSLQKKAKIIDSQLKTAQDDLEDFQLEKQRKLNELIVVATLRFHQIQHIVNDVFPHDLNPTLVFESERLVKLQHRIKELEHEKLLQKRHMRESRKQHVQLIKDRKTFDAKISEMEETCAKLMLDKFGQVVDLEKIETVTVNRTIEELKEKLRLTENDCANDVKQFDKEIENHKEKVTAMIQDNTKRLTQLAMLLTEQNQYTSTLDNRQKKVSAEFVGQRKSDIREKQRLIQLIQLQAQEVDALKEEILLLSRKGGHILPPTHPPLSQNVSTTAAPKT
ncbi:cilia- and flagella-associated protein 44-like isoform X2 [Physella acuta]|uniref:cilia- and flagella-associated protein 44-like isoform X2 n=1 Tax=Physella acuta TaxID=109671 RepID=UPI0027DC2572|nr:cilia- and flagella-associated protein 44-like isoform X2 [Physella acuta]